MHATWHPLMHREAALVWHVAAAFGCLCWAAHAITPALLPSSASLREDTTDEFAQRWIQQHILDAQAAGKPLLLEEFGL